MTGIIKSKDNKISLDTRVTLNLFENLKYDLKNIRLGEVIFGVIVLHKNSDLKENELTRFCIDKLADYQLPIGYDFVKNLPRGSLNKISKHIYR